MTTSLLRRSQFLSISIVDATSKQGKQNKPSTTKRTLKNKPQHKSNFTTTRRSIDTPARLLLPLYLFFRGVVVVAVTVLCSRVGVVVAWFLALLRMSVLICLHHWWHRMLIHLLLCAESNGLFVLFVVAPSRYIASLSTYWHVSPGRAPWSDELFIFLFIN